MGDFRYTLGTLRRIAALRHYPARLLTLDLEDAESHMETCKLHAPCVCCQEGLRLHHERHEKIELKFACCNPAPNASPSGETLATKTTVVLVAEMEMEEKAALPPRKSSLKKEKSAPELSNATVRPPHQQTPPPLLPPSSASSSLPSLPALHPSSSSSSSSSSSTTTTQTTQATQTTQDTNHATSTATNDATEPRKRRKKSKSGKKEEIEDVLPVESVAAEDAGQSSIAHDETGAAPTSEKRKRRKEKPVTTEVDATTAASGTGGSGAPVMRGLARGLENIINFDPMKEQTVLPADWNELNSKFVCLVASNVSHLAGDLRIAPFAHTSSGAVDLIYFQNIAKMEILDLLVGSLENGRYISSPSVTYKKVRAFVLVPTGKPGIVDLDGEEYETLPTAIEVHPGVLRVCVAVWNLSLKPEQL